MDRTVNHHRSPPGEATGRRGVSPERSGAGSGRFGVSRGDPLYGALDLGTNNCRLLLAAPSPGGFQVVDAFSRIVRLGEGAGHSGQLNEAAMRRTIAALRVCANKLRWWKVDRRRLIATEACRMAENGPAFLDRVEEELGLRLEIIDRHTEARLAVAGASPLIDPDARDVLLFDIGGGSTELSWVSAARGSHVIKAWTSMPAGVVTIAERFGGEEVSAATFEAMCAHVRPMVRAFAGGLAADAGRRIPDHVLGTSGTVTTICGVHLDLRRYDRSRVDGCWLRRDDIFRVTETLRAMSHGERVRHPCIGAERADLVLAGCAILVEIIEAWPAERVRVADRGLREGILTGLMTEDGAYGRSG